MAARSLPLIAVERLQPGLYVVLDVGWRNHPFLRDRFLIRSEQQIEQIRALGLREVRWWPERSRAQPLDEPDTLPEVPLLSPAAATVTADDDIWTASEPPTESQWRQASLEQVEAEYADLVDRHRQLTTDLARDPLAARETVEQLSDALIGAVTGCDQPAVRLLSERVGDRASEHEVGCAALSLLLARDCGFSPQGLRELAAAALLHDIGKTRLPGLLNADAEGADASSRQAMQRHVELGVELLQPMHLPPAVLRAIAEHHEHWDGTGFPAAIGGLQLSRPGRILAIVNRYLNLIAPPGDRGLTPYQAMQRLYAVERTHFDPGFLARFVRVMGVYPPGTLVELTDHRMALVIAARPGASLLPRVQLLGPDPNAEPGEEVDLDDELRVHCSVVPSQLDADAAARALRFARMPFYVEAQTAPEWGAWGPVETELLVF